jgi:formiminoglutamate deiminase
VSEPALIWCQWALIGDRVEPGVEIEIRERRFARVEIGAEPTRAEVQRPGVSLPAAANVHSHAFHRALRHHSQVGGPGGGTFWTWRQQMYQVASTLDPDRYHDLARRVFAEMAAAGYGVVGEFHYVHHRPDGTPYPEPGAMAEALVSAAGDAGVRITLLDALYLHGGLDGERGYAPPGPGQRRFTDASVDAWADRLGRHRFAEHGRVGAAVHSVRAVDPAGIAAAVSAAGDLGVVLHAHVSEQSAENDQCHTAHGATPVEVLAAAGALGPRFTAIHATHLTDRDLALLGGSGAHIGLCPTTEADLGDGIGPFRRLADAGATLTIGSDSHAIIDPFVELRAIESGERLGRRRRGVFTAAELLAALTGGHRALGWDDAGRIAPGFRADLVTVSLDSPRTSGAGDDPAAIAAALAHSATAADITHVIIDGATRQVPPTPPGGAAPHDPRH